LISILKIDQSKTALQTGLPAPSLYKNYRLGSRSVCDLWTGWRHIKYRRAYANEVIPCHQFNLTYYSWCLVPVLRLQNVAPYYIFVYLYFSGPQESWSVHVCCLHLKMEFRSCTRGRQWCGIIYCHLWTASIKPRLLVLVQAMLHEGFPFHQFNLTYFSWCLVPVWRL